MDQENKQSRDNFSLGFDDEAFNNLWDDSQYMSADKPLDEGADLLSASSLGKALDWGELAKDDDLWSGLDMQVAEEARSLGTIGIALSSLESMAGLASKPKDSHIDLSADIALLERKVHEKLDEKAGNADSEASEDAAEGEGTGKGSGEMEAAAEKGDADGDAESDESSQSGEKAAEGEVIGASSLLAEDADGGDMQMTERARMGRVEPENEVETSEHVLGHDAYYTDAQCVTRDPEKIRRRIIWLVAAVIGILLGAVIYFVFSLLGGDVRINYTQKGVFQMSNGRYHHVYASPATGQAVMCSDERGIVFDRGELVAEFWPGLGGCRNVRLSKDGKAVWLLGKGESANVEDIYHVYLEPSLDGSDKATGFNPLGLKQVKLTDRIGDALDVAGSNVYYFGRSEGKTPEFRKVHIPSQQVEAVALPEDALPCGGMEAHRYGYVSGDSIVFMADGKETRVSLALPKLGCSRDQALACVLGSGHSWSVLCQESIVFGEGSSVEAPVQLDDASLRDGGTRYVLLTNSKGVDLITQDYWRHIDSSVDEKLALSHPLTGAFEFGVRPDKATSTLYGTDGGMPIKLARVEQNDAVFGQITPLTTPDNFVNIANLFVRNGTAALIVGEDSGMGKTRLGLWDLQSGRIGEVISIDGRIDGIHVSPTGNAGFVSMRSGTVGAILWYDWEKGESIGKTTFSGTAVSDALWSEDHKHAIVRYEDGSSELYARDGQEMRLVRHYAADIVVAFADDSVLWLVEDHQAMFERISDGARSVINSALEPYLDGFTVAGITVHPSSNDVVFWGPSGMLDYDAKRDTVRKVTDKPIRWATPDHVGRYVATSEGLLDLSEGALVAIEMEPGYGRMMWSGSNKYLVSSDLRYRLNIGTKKGEMIADTGAGIRLYGANAGMHPSADYVLRDRSRLTSLELFTERSHILAVFGGSGTDSWCFKTEEGLLQGAGRTCKMIAKKSDEPQVTVLPESDPLIARQMGSLMMPTTPKTFTRQPVVFSDDVKLFITTLPDKLDLVFVAVSGELPEGLAGHVAKPENAPESGAEPQADGAPAAAGTDDVNDILSPFRGAFKRDQNVYRVDVASEGYEPRSVEFQLDHAQVDLYIPLLRAGASALIIKYTNPADGSDLFVSQNLDIEVRSAMVVSGKAVEKCLKRQPQKVLKLLVDEKGTLNLVADGLDDKEKACLEPVVSDLVSRSAAEMPGLSDVPMLRMDIQFP
ncbi:MAG: hypothetical protein IKY83_14410 [Proteobacteria bacterium]|nr:hypothetical protein [Pseudomonadota bacterium]